MGREAKRTRRGPDVVSYGALSLEKRCKRSIAKLVGELFSDQTTMERGVMNSRWAGSRPCTVDCAGRERDAFLKLEVCSVSVPAWRVERIGSG